MKMPLKLSFAKWWPFCPGKDKFKQLWLCVFSICARSVFFSWYAFPYTDTVGCQAKVIRQTRCSQETMKEKSPIHIIVNSILAHFVHIVNGIDDLDVYTARCVC